MSAIHHLARRSALPAAAYVLGSKFRDRSASCDHELRETPVGADANISLIKTEDHEQTSLAAQPPKAGMLGGGDEQGYFHGLFPKRQLWQPRVPYPLWDNDWDGRREKPTGDAEADRKRHRHVRETGVTRHIILIRHGQYDETHKDDKHRKLTELGRQQSDLTGRRIAEMVKGFDDAFGPCNVKILRVSDMTRAKETAEIIAAHLPDIERAEPDPLLNEGRPSHHIPSGKMDEEKIKKTDEGHLRIEEAFKKYLFRAPIPENAAIETDQPNNVGEIKTNPKHEFEVIVCHANVIRYFYCRALQLPPEAWLRQMTFNCSLTYLVVRPHGSVSCRMLGDIGHLPYNLSTFSHHHGFNW